MRDRDNDMARKKRAMREHMEVRPVGGNRYRVYRERKAYDVNILQGTCTCPDHTERGNKCKHIWRVELSGYMPVLEKKDWRPSGDFVWF